MSKTAKRRMEIFNILAETKTVDVNDLVKRFDVSAMTIRRDLALFEKQGLLTTNYGGAYLNQGAAIEPSFSLKAGHMMEKKKIIGRAAADLVKSGDSIIIDCGTTTLQLLPFIQDKNITVITNSWLVLNYLRANRKIKLLLAPGEYNDLSAGVISSLTVDFYNKFNADTVFMSTQGFDIEKGVTVPDTEDAMVKNSLMNAAKNHVLLVGSEKFGKIFLSKYAEVYHFDYIITDSEVDKAYIEKIKEYGIKIIVAGI